MNYDSFYYYRLRIRFSWMMLPFLQNTKMVCAKSGINTDLKLTLQGGYCCIKTLLTKSSDQKLTKLFTQKSDSDFDH